MNTSLKVYYNNSIVSKYTIISGTFLIIFSSMVLTIDIYGFSIPFYDEWDAEAFATYAPYLKGKYEVANLFEPHNGHRIVLTRLSALAFFLLNGGWDPELQMLLSAFLHALTGAFIVYTLVRDKVKHIDLFAIFSIVIMFSIPFSWMSVLVAFQTQFYFMLFFAAIAIFSLSESRYFLGYLFAFCSYLSMTPGAFVLPAFIIGIAVNAINAGSFRRKDLVRTLTAIGIFLLMILYRAETSADDIYRARNILDFSISTVAAFWWPFRLSNPLGMFVFAPFLIFLFRSIFSDRTHTFYIILGAFVICQILAMGYFRGAYGVPPANRYLSIFSLGICVNLLCLVDMIKLKKSRNVLWGMGWLLVVSYGVMLAAHTSVTIGLPERYAQNSTTQSILTGYLRDRDMSVFEEYSELEISYTNPQRLANILSDPIVVSILPSSLVPTNQDKLSSIKYFLFEFNLVLLVLGMLALFLGSILFVRQYKRSAPSFLN